MSKCLVIADACCKVPEANIKGRSGFGKSACGCVIIDEQGQVFEYKKYLGERTVPQAEFEGLIFALDKASEHSRRDIEVRMDSELVIKWMNGDYRLRKEHIKPLFDEATKMSKRFKNIEYNHHSRKADLAKHADKLSNDAIREYE